MKKNKHQLAVLFGLIGLLLSFAGKAQIEQGTKIFGGTFQLHFENGNNQVIIAPDFSYTLKENLTIGGKAGISYYQILDDHIKPIVGIYARKHFFLNDNFAFFGEALAEYQPTFSNDFRIGVLPGLTYFLDEKIAVEWAFGGIIFATNNDEGQFDVSFSPASNSRFGIKYYLRK